MKADGLCFHYDKKWNKSQQCSKKEVQILVVYEDRTKDIWDWEPVELVEEEATW